MYEPTTATTKIMTDYIGGSNSKVNLYSAVGASIFTDKMKAAQIRLIESHKHHMNDDDKARAERTIAELEKDLPADWRYKHLTGPAA